MNSITWILLGLAYHAHQVASQYDTATCSQACNNDDVWIENCLNLYGPNTSTPSDTNLIQCIDKAGGSSGDGLKALGLCVVCNEDDLGAYRLEYYQELVVVVLALDDNGLASALAVNTFAASDLVAYFSTSILPVLQGSTTVNSPASTPARSTTSLAPAVTTISPTSSSSLQPTTTPLFTTTPLSTTMARSTTTSRSPTTMTTAPRSALSTVCPAGATTCNLAVRMNAKTSNNMLFSMLLSIFVTVFGPLL